MSAPAIGNPPVDLPRDHRRFLSRLKENIEALGTAVSADSGFAALRAQLLAAIAALTRRVAALERGSGVAPIEDVPTITAGATFSAFVLLASVGSGAIAADIATAGHAGKVVGIALSAATDGFDTPYAATGDIVENPDWTWTPGALLWAGEDGEIEEVPGSGQFSQWVGIALDETHVFVLIGSAVVPSATPTSAFLTSRNGVFESAPLDAMLIAIAALVTSADKGLYFTGADAPALFDLTSVARTLVAQTTQAAMRSTGLGATTVGGNFFILPNPSAITFPKIAADNSVSAESAATHRTSIGFVDPILDKASPGNIGTTTPGVVRVAAGSASAAGLQVSTAGNGLYAPATDEVGIAQGGFHAGSIVGAQQLVMGNTQPFVSSANVTARIQAISQGNTPGPSSMAGFAFNNTNAALAPRFSLNRSRGSFSGGTITRGIVQTDDVLGRWDVAGDDGAVFRSAAYIIVESDTGTPDDSPASMPGRMLFGVTADGDNAPTTALTIKATRRIGIGQSTPLSTLHLKAGSTTANSAPFQADSGTLETAARAGVTEYNGNWYDTKAGNIRLGRPGVIEADNFADVGNVGTGVDTLYTETVLGNTLDVNGAALHVQCGGVTTADASDTRQIIASFGGTAFADTGAVVTASAAEWSFWATIVRDSSSSVRAIGAISISNVGGATKTVPFAKKITGVTLSSNQTLLVTGESAGTTVSNNDVVAYALKAAYAPHGLT